MKTFLNIFISLMLIIALSNILSGHCDTMEGPVIADAKKAIEENNINYILKWVQPVNENEIKESFELMMKVRVLGPEAKELSEKYFFETLVRVHRSGEGVPFTGVKPLGTPIDEKIKGADKSIELGNLSPLEKIVAKNIIPELKKRFEKVMKLKNFDVNDVKAGREYIEAYVQFFHFAEGEVEGHAHEAEGQKAAAESHGHELETDHLSHLNSFVPWALAGLFFIISTTLFILLKRKK